MKIYSLFLFIVTTLFITPNVFADSPLTSTDFNTAYSHLNIIKLAKDADGKLSKELTDYLMDANNPIDVKMAIVNGLGWKISGQKNSLIFYEALEKYYGYEELYEFMEKGSAANLLTMAYLLAMDNYFNVKMAYDIARVAVVKNKNSYTANIIYGLIKAQTNLKDRENWCAVYNATDAVRKDKSLVMDMNESAKNIIFKYMDGYKRYCD